jgi:hypothetical protein
MELLPPFLSNEPGTAEAERIVNLKTADPEKIAKHEVT